MTGIEIAVASAAGLSAAIGAASAIGQSKAAANTAEFNAKVLENDAIATRQAAEFEETKVRDRARRLKAAQAAAFGASGVTAEGSPLSVLADTTEQAELDALAVRYSGSVAEARARSQAAAERSNASNFRNAGYLQAGSSLLTGVSGVADSGVFD